jgi:hypothetical protein
MAAGSWWTRTKSSASVDDPYEKHRATMRARHGYVSPFRLGIAVGEAGENLPPPYARGSRGFKNFQDGVVAGRQNRERLMASIPSDWLRPGAVVPVTIETVDTLLRVVREVKRDAELRKGVRAIVGFLRDGEWADLLTTDPDLAALEEAVHKLRWP